jgi:hypothetical protein
MLDELAHVLNMSSFALVAMILMCLICGFIVAQLQDGIPGQLIGFAAIFGAGLAGNALFRKFEIHIIGSKDLDGVLATTVGLVVGVAAYVTIKLTLTAIYGTARAVPQTDVDAVRSVSTGLENSA